MPRTKKTRATIVRNRIHSKYNNRVSIGLNSSRKFKSSFEASVSNSNPGLLYEPCRFTYTREYTPDFKLITRKGKEVYIECKGFFNSADRSKIAAIKRSNPNLDLRMLFLNANKRLYKNPNSATYGEWCDAHNIPWASGYTIPESWYE